MNIAAPRNASIPPVAQDATERERLELLHPSGWTNPAPADRYGLVVVGGGPAGLVAAHAAAALGAVWAVRRRALAPLVFMGTALVAGGSADARGPRAGGGDALRKICPARPGGYEDRAGRPRNGDPETGKVEGQTSSSRPFIRIARAMLS